MLSLVRQRSYNSMSYVIQIKKPDAPDGVSGFWYAGRDSTCAAAQATSGCKAPPAPCQEPSGSNPCDSNQKKPDAPDGVSGFLEKNLNNIKLGHFWVQPRKNGFTPETAGSCASLPGSPERHY